MSLPDTPPTASEDKPKKGTAIYIAILAVLLAIISVGDDEASQTVTTSSIEAANAYAFFQAKNIRQTSIRLAADDFEAQLADPSLPPGSRARLQKHVESYRATAARYESEPETGEGKKELLERARRFEAERDLGLKRDPYFNYAQAFLQIAIVLASAALILGGTLLLWVSGAFGILGTLAGINGFTLLVALPFLG
jgi:hypothetical protein